MKSRPSYIQPDRMLFSWSTYSSDITSDQNNYSIVNISSGSCLYLTIKSSLKTINSLFA